MISLSYDLHIHSCLSPCGDGDMTPANIIGMSALKGLDVVALTDHNSSKNCRPFLKMAEEYGLIAIPGMEVTTAEEVHVVCLFPDLTAALDFDRFVSHHLIKVANRPHIFGEQLLYGLDDQPIGEEPYLLINSTDLSFDDLYSHVDIRGGVMIPAHIDKSSNSLLANLGFIPPDSRFGCVELKNMAHLHRLKKAHPYLDNCRIISNSDAHYLEQINEPELTILSKSRRITDILEALNAKTLRSSK